VKKVSTKRVGGGGGETEVPEAPAPAPADTSGAEPPSKRRRKKGA